MAHLALGALALAGLSACRPAPGAEAESPTSATNEEPRHEASNDQGSLGRVTLGPSFAEAPPSAPTAQGRAADEGELEVPRVDVDGRPNAAGGTGAPTSAPGRAPTVASSTRPANVGALSPEEIRSVVKGHVGEVRSCYALGLAHNPSLEGRISIKFKIGPDGAVQSTTVLADNLGDQKVADCVAAEIQSWRFPPPRGGGTVVVAYPFVFESK